MQPKYPPQKKLYDLLKLGEYSISPKGWYTGLDCLWCGKEKHFGIKFHDRRRIMVTFNCHKCQESGAEFKLFKKLGIIDFLLHGGFVEDYSRVDKMILLEEQSISLDLAVPSKAPPLGFKPIEYHPYLEGRGFLSHQYPLYSTGVTEWYNPLLGYALFLIMEDSECKGYLARDTEDRGKSFRHFNDPGVDFAKLLFGLDEVTENTKTIILTEGLMSKGGVDRALRLWETPEIKCLATFGKKISQIQEEKIYLKGVENIIFMYDPDALNEVIRFSRRLSCSFKRVECCFLKDKDPGDMTPKEIYLCLEGSKKTFEFSMSYVHKRI